MRTVEEILARMQAILDAAAGRSLTDVEATEYEACEGELQNRRRDDQIRARQAAYVAPVPGQYLNVAPTRADDTQEKAFVAYLRTGRGNADISDLAVDIRNDQTVGTPAGGGYTVPAGFRQKLVEVMKAFGGLAGEVDSFDTGSGNPVNYPVLDDTANAGAITAEGAANASGADLAFGTVTMGAYTYTSAGAGANLPLRVSWELLQDSAFDISGLITRAMGTRIARKQAADWATGTGTGMPKGIVATGVTADATLAALSTITYDDLVAAEAALDPAYEQNAKWVMNKATWMAIRKVKDGANRPLILPQAVSGMSSGVEKLLLGYPVVIDQQMPAYNTALNPFAVLGDLKESYVIRRVSNFAIVVNPWTRANNRETEFTAYERADGTVQNRKGYVVLANHA